MSQLAPGRHYITSSSDKGLVGVGLILPTVQQLFTSKRTNGHPLGNQIWTIAKEDDGTYHLSVESYKHTGLLSPPGNEVIATTHAELDKKWKISSWQGQELYTITLPDGVTAWTVQPFEQDSEHGFVIASHITSEGPGGIPRPIQANQVFTFTPVDN